MAPSQGVTVDQLYVVITNPNHPLAAGLSGRVQAYRVPREMNWGAHLAPGAQVIATLAPSLTAAGDGRQMTPSRHFSSDNNAGALPEVLRAIAEANSGHVPSYGGDPYTAAAEAARAKLLEQHLRGVAHLRRSLA